MVYIGIITVLFAIDYLIKYYVEKHVEEGQVQKILKGKLLLKKTYNKGAMLNALEERQELVAGLSTGITICLIIWQFQLLCKKGYGLLKVALSFIIGGALGNVYDRLIRKKVLDYLSIHTKREKISSVIFNLADVFIFIGSMFLLLDSFLRDRKK